MYVSYKISPELQVRNGKAKIQLGFDWWTIRSTGEILQIERANSASLHIAITMNSLKRCLTQLPLKVFGEIRSAHSLSRAPISLSSLGDNLGAVAVVSFAQCMIPHHLHPY
jgi:hypothetical protein